MTRTTIGRFIISLAIPQLAGGIGSLFTMNAVDAWYTTLNRPAIAPPNWVFGPVWTTLFLLMGIALFLVWNTKAPKDTKQVAYLAFAAQLALNISWSLLFFGAQNPRLAFAEILVLIAAIMWNIYAFSRIHRRAAWLLAPYLAWVIFASTLNYQFWMLNP